MLALPLTFAFGHWVCHHNNLQPNLDVNITGRDVRRAKENMSTETTRTSNLHGVRPTVGSSAVKGDCTALFVELACCRAILREYI